MIIRLICVLGVLIFGEASYCTYHPEAVREFNKIREAGHELSNGDVIINNRLMGEYARSHPGEYIKFPKNVVSALIGAGISYVEGGLFVSILADELADGAAFEAVISLDEYNKALEEDGPIAAALTNPQGDSCNIL